MGTTIGVIAFVIVVGAIGYFVWRDKKTRASSNTGGGGGGKDIGNPIQK